MGKIVVSMEYLDADGGEFGIEFTEQHTYLVSGDDIVLKASGTHTIAVLGDDDMPDSVSP